MIFAIILGVAGVIALAGATYISTVKISGIDKRLSNVVESIDKFKFDCVMASICKLDYGHGVAQKQLTLFQRNYLIAEQKLLEERDELAQRALDDAIRLAESWATLLSGDESQELKAATSNKIKKVLENKEFSTLTKLEKVEKIWKDNQRAASERIIAINEKWQEDKRLRREIEEEKSRWHNRFLKLQIAGLIFLTLVGLIEGVIKVCLLSRI